LPNNHHTDHIDPTLTTAALAALELSINKALDYDPGSRRALAKLQGQVLAIDISAPKLSFYIRFQTDTIQLHGSCEDTVDTRLRGSLSALANLMLSDSATLANSGVEVFGRTALLSKLQKISKNIDIDWEEPITQIAGDLLGHQSAVYIRWRCQWLQQRLQTGLRLGAEFLTEEHRSFAARTEIDFFNQQVDNLRLATDRAQARLAALIKRTTHSTQHSK